MKAQEYRNLEQSALEVEVAKSRRELLDLRCKVALGEEVHPHQIRTVKKNIARMLTVATESAGVEGGN